MIDYGSRLDREETTRSYINQRKARLATEPVKSYEPNNYKSRYNSFGAMKHEKDFMYDSSSVERDFHYYRKSKQTSRATFGKNCFTKTKDVIMSDSFYHYAFIILIFFLKEVAIVLHLILVDLGD